jgi:hypothetical protein
VCASATRCFASARPMPDEAPDIQIFMIDEYYYAKYRAKNQ